MYPENLLISSLIKSHQLIIDLRDHSGKFLHCELYLFATRSQNDSFLWPVLVIGSQLISSQDLQSKLSSWIEKLVSLHLVVATLHCPQGGIDTQLLPEALALMATSDCGWGGEPSCPSCGPSPKRLIDALLRLVMYSSILHRYKGENVLKIINKLACA
jgi:hypothetical protein